MPKALTYIGLALAAVMLLIFGLDAALGIPFKKASMIFDIVVIVCSLVLLYLGWSTLKDIR